MRYRARTYGETNISRFRHGWLLLKMSWVAFKKIKWLGRKDFYLKEIFASSSDNTLPPEDGKVFIFDVSKVCCRYIAASAGIGTTAWMRMAPNTRSLTRQVLKRNER